MSLHKHVVSAVIKRLITFASLALSTLAPVFFLRGKQILVANFKILPMGYVGKRIRKFYNY